ncbi:LPXTG cell wall anchor domain-containing protein [Streptomyces sp. NPDC058579]|uniref:LPXTG cell wall anchor domain-containing protein n=1 Tax=Streptomyces sp. NPDC058579 TaxID=3346548 RepID=UPI003663AC3D
MTTARPRRSSWFGRAAVLALSVGILSGSLPLLDNVQEAQAAPKRCTEMYQTPNSAPRLGSLPGFKAPGKYQWRTLGDTKRTYSFDNPRKRLSGLDLPSAEDLDKILPDPSKYPNASPEHAWAYWKQNQAGKSPYKGTFNEYVNSYYTNGEANSRGGNAYEAEVARYFKLGGQNWYCQYSMAEEMPELFRELVEELGEDNVKKDRRFDAIKTNGRDKIIYEFKSGTKQIDTKQLLVDQALGKRGYKVVYVFGEPPSKAVEARLRAHGLSWYQHRATPDARYTPHPQYTRQDPAFSGRTCPTATTLASAKAAGCGSSRGAANDFARNSGRTKEEAQRRQAAARQAPGAPFRMRGPGGIDFTTMELRYITEPVKGKGMDYGFKAKMNDDEDENPSWGGGAKIDLSSDTMFTWLALHPNRFWVNLNPDQPDQVTDDKLAKTDAGRILLEADLEMKHDLSRVMVPDNPVGNRLWDSFQHVNGAPCWKTYRYYIEPAPAQVREEDGKLYILDAPMDVKAAKIDFDEGFKCKQPESVQEYNFRQIQEIAIPEVEKLVNTAPQYADLRSVYTSRIAAEWIKQRDAVKPGDFHALIGSDDATAWPSRTKWDRDKVYADYMKSYREGDFHFKRTYPQDGSVLEFSFYLGGVDFSKQPKQNISKARFQAENPDMPDTVNAAVKSTTAYADTDTAFLGGNNTGKDSGGTDPTPTPTPTKPGPDPTDKPTTPAPSPSTPGNGNGSGGQTPPAKDPDGGLADTGSDTPVGLIVGLAAVLAAVGAGLLWWKRRRTMADG